MHCSTIDRKTLLGYQSTLNDELRLIFSSTLEETEDELTSYLSVLEEATHNFSDLIDELTSESKPPQSSPSQPIPESSSQQTVLSIMYSHHIIAKSKITLIKTLFKSLNLKGLLLIGWPGAIIIEGSVQSVDFFFEEMKGLKWKLFREKGRLEIEEEVFKVQKVVEETRVFSKEVRETRLGESILGLCFGN